MAGAKSVILRLVSSQKTTHAAVLLDRRQQVSASGKNLVRISLMAYVPHQPVDGRIEGVVQGDRELDGAQRRAGMSADAGHGFENVLTDLICNRLQFLGTQVAQIGGRINVLQKVHGDAILARLFCGRHCNATIMDLLPPEFGNCAVMRLSDSLCIAKYSAPSQGW